MIDPDTAELTTKRTHDERELVLVMSDEFNQDNRSFMSNDDALFTAIHQPGLTNEEMQFYDSSYVTTRGGSLVLKTTAEKTTWTEYDDNKQEFIYKSRNYTSAMLQSWNQFCFTGGVLEMSIQLPGGSSEGVGGMWPAAWMMGNLARAAFPASTKGVWPWSYDACDGTVPHLERRQETTACSAAPGHGLHPYQGRGSPEMDIFEVNLRPPSSETPDVNNTRRVEGSAFMSTSLQVAPGVSQPHRPVNGHPLNESYIWYEAIEMNELGEFNSGFWGQECAALNDDPPPNEQFKYWEDAVSANFDLTDTHFQMHHVYRLEWQPGAEGYLAWFLDGEFLFRVGAASLLNLTGALIPVEPMYLVFNTAVSQSWGFPQPCDLETCDACYNCFDCHNPNCQCSLPDSLKSCANMPAEMKIDYIRLYQDPLDSSHTTSCSPPGYPTEQFIKDHEERFEAWSPKTPPLPSSDIPFTPGNNAPLRGGGTQNEFAHPIMLAFGLVICVAVTTLCFFRTHGLSDHFKWTLPLEPRSAGEAASDKQDGDSRVSETTALLQKKVDPCDNSPNKGTGMYGL